MDIKQLAVKPTLTKFSAKPAEYTDLVNDAGETFPNPMTEIEKKQFEKYGGELDFFIMWPLTMEQFVRFPNMPNGEIVYEFLIDQDTGKRLFEDYVELKDKLIVQAIVNAIWKELGK